jgi:hypothetical protein
LPRSINRDPDPIGNVDRDRDANIDDHAHADANPNGLADGQRDAGAHTVVIFSDRLALGTISPLMN